MLKDSQTSDKISALMTQALFALRDLVDNDTKFEMDYSQVVTVFLQGVISTAIDLAELHSPGVSPMIYADIESSSKLGGLRAIVRMQSENGSISYSVSDIDANDQATAMNYLGQQMSTTLFKGIHELPLPLRNQEMLLRAVEALLSNLLHEKFNNPHNILDSFCEHVHMALDDLATRIKSIH